MNNSVLIIDNNDSFTFNLAQYIKFAEHIPIILNINDINNVDFTEYNNIILSPGPKLPDDYPNLINFILKYKESKKILGVCLGHQAIARAFGGDLYNLDNPRHGYRKNLIKIKENDLFYKDIDDYSVGLYHSWAVKDNLPDCLEVTAYDENDVIMSIKHNKFNIYGVQFHPESIITKNGLKMIKNWLYCF